MTICRQFRYATIFALVFSMFAGADTLQKDPENRFTVLVPLGWRVTSTPEKMQMTMGDSFVHILHVPGQGSAMKALQYAVGQAGEMFAGGQALEHGETTMGGEHALFANYSGYDDRSVAVYLRFVATDSGWVFYAGSPQSGFTTLRDTFLKIEHSFQLTKGDPVSPAPSEPSPTTAPK
jgi:hypothetical protein